jgi:hypothetical protein
MTDTTREEPFFARYLEGQDYPEVRSDLRAGRHWPPATTQKYPSDDDDDPVVVE